MRWIALLIALMMYSQGIVLLGHPDSGGTASLSFLIRLCAGSTHLASVALFLLFPLSVAAWALPRAKLFLIPPLAVSLVYGIGSIMVIVDGVYADGYVPKSGGWFIYNDQVMIVVITLIHIYCCCRLVFFEDGQ
jgi:hypothetical protein